MRGDPRELEHSSGILIGERERARIDPSLHRHPLASLCEPLVHARESYRRVAATRLSPTRASSAPPREGGSRSAAPFGGRSWMEEAYVPAALAFLTERR